MRNRPHVLLPRFAGLHFTTFTIGATRCLQLSARYSDGLELRNQRFVRIKWFRIPLSRAARQHSVNATLKRRVKQPVNELMLREFSLTHDQRIGAGHSILTVLVN